MKMLSDSLVMAVESFHAWLLHKRPISDHTFQLILFTKENGVLSCLYRTGRSSKKQTIVAPLVPLWTGIETRIQGKYYIHKVEATAPALWIKQKSALFSCLYLNELLYFSLAFSEPFPALFDAYTTSLQQLSETQNTSQIEPILRNFEKKLLQVCGHLTSFRKIAYTHLPIEAERYYRFVPNAGFLLDTEGPFLGKYILACDDSSFELVEPEVLKVAKFIMRQSIDFLLDGRKLKSRELFLSPK